MGGSCYAREGFHDGSDAGDRKGLQSSRGGAGRALRAPVSEGSICRRRRGKCGARSGAHPGSRSSRFLWGCSFESENGERETWEPGRCLRPFLQAHRVRALVGRRGEGAAETEGCPCRAPFKHLPTRVRLSSPLAVSAARRGSSSADQCRAGRGHSVRRPGAPYGVTHTLPLTPVGIFIKIILECFTPRTGTTPRPRLFGFFLR